VFGCFAYLILGWHIHGENNGGGSGFPAFAESASQISSNIKMVADAFNNETVEVAHLRETSPSRTATEEVD